MIDDFPNDVKKAILSQEISNVKKEIYRLSVSVEVRKLAGYSEEENKGFIYELERLVKVRDALTDKINELQ